MIHPVWSVVVGCNQECTVGSFSVVTAVTAGTESTIHSWLRPTTTDHNGWIVIHMHR
jgi:hypothetical protein